MRFQKRLHDPNVFLPIGRRSNLTPIGVTDLNGTLDFAAAGRHGQVPNL
jgi:hypothetical protein